MNQRLATLVLAAALALLAGCNTVQGLGQDIERGGEKLQNAAERAKR
ncbi:MAG: entericidin A/B family lipoprotein [Bacteroidota bacterium]